jgi:phage terminase large subunit-like protein
MRTAATVIKASCGSFGFQALGKTVPRGHINGSLKRAVREQQTLFNVTVVLIEDRASGTQLIQELITEGCSAVTRYQPTGDKTMRLRTPACGSICRGMRLAADRQVAS